jgi:hypothetical protein
MTTAVSEAEKVGAGATERFQQDDYAELLQRLLTANDDVTAILSNNFNVVLGALRVAASYHPERDALLALQALIDAVDDDVTVSGSGQALLDALAEAQAFLRATQAGGMKMKTLQMVGQ